MEVNNNAIGPGTNVNTAPELLSAIRKTIKYVLMGLQETNYPISYPEQNKVLQDYMQLVNNKEYNPSQRVYPNHFIGPSSYTLQMANIAPINNNAVIPNIRNDYTVTDKADGERHMMYISNNGKIYLISHNLFIRFIVVIPG